MSSITVDLGRFLSVEQIAWIIQQSCSNPEDDTEFGYLQVDGRLTFGCSSATAWHNLCVTPLSDGPFFVPGSMHREVVLTTPIRWWGREYTIIDTPIGSMHEHGRLRFRERIQEALEAARSQGFPEYVPDRSS